MRLSLSFAVIAVSAATANAGLLADYDASRHDRFLSDNGTSRTFNPDFHMAGFDLSGLGVGGNGGILISDRHVLAATHFRGGSYTFVNAAGDEVTFNASQNRTMKTRVPNGTGGFSELNSDVTLVTLDRSVTGADLLTPMAVADVPLGDFEPRDVFVYDQNNRLGRNLLDGGSLDRPDGTVVLPPITRLQGDNNATWAVTYDYDTSLNGGGNGVGGDEIGLVGGDSGHGAFILTDAGDVAVIGTHYAVVTGNGVLPPNPGETYLSLTSLAAAYRTQIEGFVAADGAQARFVSVIPEPGTATLLAVGALVALRRKR